MKLSHLLYFIEVNDKALLVGVILLDTLPAKHSHVIGAVKVLHSLVMFITEQRLYTVLVLEVQISQYAVSLDDFIQYVEI